jgi:hypothetical protein
MRGANVEEPLAEENWEQLLKQTALFAAEQINRLRWRGARGGLLPEGYDPNSLAAEALAQLLSLAPADPKGRIEATAANAPRNTLDEPVDRGLRTVDRGLRTVDRGLWTAKTLHRLVRRQINRLHHRKERSLLRNAEDFSPVLTDDGEPLGLLEALPAPDADPLEILLQKESAAELEQFKDRFSASLGKERGLMRAFECLCAGIWQPKALARKLKIQAHTIENLRKRLRRQLTALCQRNGSRENQDSAQKSARIFR